VAELLGVGRNSVYEAAGRQRIPHRRLGRRLLFSRAAIIEWLEGDFGKAASRRKGGM
jgi:excisionase family DNA binding protein